MNPFTIFLLFLAVLGLNRQCLGKAVTANSVLEQHNYYRNINDMPKLSLSKELSKDCEDYAKHLATLNIRDDNLLEDANAVIWSVFDHIKYPLSAGARNEYTESICEFQDVSCVKYWYDNGRKIYNGWYYIYDDDEDDDAAKRYKKMERWLKKKYTAIVWRSSKTLGVGIAPKDPANKNGRKIMVVRYSPPGSDPYLYDLNMPTSPTPKPVNTTTPTPSSAFGKDLNIIVFLLNCLIQILV
nr:uncharacterized protein LOC123003464 [Drosophila takahashii]